MKTENNLTATQAREYKTMYLVTFRGQSITVKADNHAMAGKLGLEAMGFIPRIVGQHDLKIVKL